MTRLTTLKRDRPEIILLLFFLGALLLRYANLGSKSFWLDEAFSIHLATPTFAAVDANHPPLYYTMIYYWSRAFGQEEAILRLPSVIASLVNLALLYRLGRELASRETALLATALLAVSPLNLWYAQEARMYAPLVTVTLGMALGLALRRSTGYLLFFAALSAGLYLGYLSFPLWVGLSAIWFVLWWQEGRDPRHLFAWLIASGAAWLLFLPWRPYFQDWLQVKLLSHWMFQPIKNLLGISRLSTGFFLLLLAVAATFLVGCAAMAQKIVARPGLRRLLTGLMLAGFLAVTLFTPVPRLFGLKRVLVTGWPFVILGVAWLLTYAGKRGGAIASLLVALSLIASLATLFLLPKDDWRGLAAYLDREVGSAVVWVDPRWDRVPYDYYRPDARAREGSIKDLRELAADEASLWLVAERFPGQPIPSSPSESWLDEHWHLVEAIPFYRLELRHYAASR